jgi:type I restriction enzyme S subunit
MIDEVFSLYKNTKPNWKVTALGNICVEVKKPNHGDVENNLLSLSYGEIVNKDIESATGLVPESFNTYNIVEADDIVLRLTDLQNDKKSLRVGQVKEKGIITSAYTTVRGVGVSARWLYYTLHAYDLEKYFYSMGSGLRQSMKFDDLKNLPIAIPNIETQVLITNYLDQRLLKAKVLKESINDLKVATETSFRALIDSELQNYEIQIRLKYICSVQSGNSLSPEFINEHDLLLAQGRPYISTKDVNYIGQIKEDTDISIPESLQMDFRTTIPGDVLICSEGGSAGRKFAIVQNPSHYGNKLFACRLKNQFQPLFLFYFFFSQYFRNQFNSSMNGLIGGISKESFGGILIPVVSEHEQKKFITLITEHFEHFKRLDNTLETLSAKSEEMIKVLITNTVVGKHHVYEVKKGA